VAVGYYISNEPWFKPLKNTVSLLKLRLSYGQSGNDALAMRFPFLTEIGINQGMYWYVSPELKGLQGTTISTLGNSNATWEVSTKANLGVELGLFNDLTLIVDLFRENRTGIFMQRRSVPATSGFTGTLPYGNIGTVTNRGVDMSLEYNKAINKDLIISARGSFTYAHNEVTERDEAPGLPYYQSEMGHPINHIKGLVADGLFADQNDIDNAPIQEFKEDMRPGDIKYRDMNGDGRVNGNDVTIIGMPTTPEIVYGFGASVRWKQFDASIFFQGQARVSLLMENMHPFLDKGTQGFGMTQWIADNYWSVSKPDPGATYPRLSTAWDLNNTEVSSFWIRNGSFLRLKSVELGYTLKSFRFYVTGSNLLTFTKFKYWDPELGSGNGLSYPLQRTFNLGVQYNF
jgi:TonB-linked SusC/RagA family outer membrane protein